MRKPKQAAGLARYYEAFLTPTVHGSTDPASPANAYAWAVEIMQGLRVSEVVDATAEAFADSRVGELRPIPISPGHMAYPVPYFYPEMVELIGELLRHDFDVWIVSASNVWSVRYLTLKFLNPLLRQHGARNGIRPERVLGVSTLLTNSRRELFKDSLLIRESAPYSRLDAACLSRVTLTGRLQFPIPIYSGKVGAVWDALGRQPFLAAGDSAGDHALLTFSEHRLWIARLENPELQGATAQLIQKQQPDRWLVQPTLLNPSPGFLPDSQALIRRLKPVPKNIRSSAKRLSRFNSPPPIPSHRPLLQRLRRFALAMMLSIASAVLSKAEVPAAPTSDFNAAVESAFLLDPPSPGIWVDGVGEGYRASTQTISIEAGGAYGPRILGSQDHHYLALLSLSYGHMLGPVLGEDRFWRGNFELRVELFGGIQYIPDNEWLVGLTPHVRYSFATGSRWTPFLDIGLGTSLTDIGPPDLGSIFEFNIQGCAGFHWRLRDDLALTAEARYIHLSSAGISDRNSGLNSLVGMLGVTLFF